MTINKVGGQSAQASTEVSSETQATSGSPSDASVATFDAALHKPVPEVPSDAPSISDLLARTQKLSESIDQSSAMERTRRLHDKSGLEQLGENHPYYHPFHPEDT